MGVETYNFPGVNAAHPEHPMAVRLSDGSEHQGTPENPLAVRDADGSGFIIPDPTDSPVDPGNSSIVLLGAGEVFTGAAYEILAADNWSSVSVTAYSDVVSAVAGLSLQFSPDGTNWDRVVARTVEAGQAVQVVEDVAYRFFRVVYTNGAGIQAEFRLTTIFGNKAADLGTANDYPLKLVVALMDGGNNSMAVDGSVTPVELTYEHSGVDVDIYRIMVSWEDDGNWWAERFAGFAAELTNGCTLEHTRDGVVIPLVNGIPVKNNFDMESLMYDVNIQNLGQGATFLSSRYTFARFGRPIRLRAGDSMTWRVNDDLTGLIEGHAVIEGEFLV